MQNVTVDRDKYIGGSDIPIIMGLSPFKSRFDLLLEKAGLKDNDFEGNDYTEYGNKIEPLIRKFINNDQDLKFKEDKIVKGNYRYHDDGNDSKEKILLEIKSTSQIKNELECAEDLKDYKLYVVQMLKGMDLREYDDGILAIYKRPDDFRKQLGEDNVVFEDERLKYLHFRISDNQFLQVWIEEINDSCEKFLIDKEKLRENPMLTEEDLMPMDITNISNEIIKLEESIKSIKPIEEKIATLKEQLCEEMKKADIKTWETPGGIKITYVEGKESSEETIKIFNEKLFIEENPDLYEDYMIEETKKISGRKPYVKITLPKE